MDSRAEGADRPSHSRTEGPVEARERAAAGRRYELLFELAPDAYLVTDGEGVVEAANRAARRLLGAAGGLAGESLLDFVEPAMRDAFRVRLDQLAAGVEATDWHTRLRPRGGGTVDAQVSCAPTLSDAGTLASVRWIVRDVTGRVHLDRHRQRVTAQLRDLVDASLVLAAESDAAALLRVITESARRVVGGEVAFLQARGALGGDAQTSVASDPDGETAAAAAGLLARERTRLGAGAGRPDPGDAAPDRPAPLRHTISARLDWDPVQPGWLLVGRADEPFSDSDQGVLEALAAQARIAIANALLQRELTVQASTDPLTELPNRRAFERALAAEPSRRSAILAVDVDDLKLTNDAYGHSAGDRVLRALADVLRGLARDGDLVARTGGDEFSVLLDGADGEEAMAVAGRYLDALREVTLPSGPISVSIGCAATVAGSPLMSTARAADAALLSAKQAGRHRALLWGSTAGGDDGSRPQRWADTVTDLLSVGSVDTAFQPVVDLQSGAVVGHEALSRVPGMGARQEVDRLFSAARRLGLHRDLDWLCLRSAVAHCGTVAGGDLYINVSLARLLDPARGADQLVLLLAGSPLGPADVVLEISDRDSLRDLDHLDEVLNAYRSRGFRFALDDLGDGALTLEAVTVTRPDFVKLSRRLLAGAGRRPEVLRTAVALGSTLGATVIAKGVETQTGLAAVRELGVPLGQGFLLGPPALAPGRAEDLPG